MSAPASTVGLPAVDAFREVFRVPPAAESHGTAWRDVSTFLWRTPWLSSYELPETDDLIVAMHTGGTRHVQTRIGRDWSDRASSPGDLHLVPPGLPTAYRPRGELEFVSVHIRSERLRTVAEDRPAMTRELPFRFAFHDPFVAACVQALNDEMRAPREQGALFVDSVADALALHVLRTPAPAHTQARPKSSLSRAALSRVCALVEARLEQGVSLDELAAEARSSRFHFARAFRDAMGVPPHRYLTHRRIERAKELLATTDLALAEIALAVGFGNQSHFTLRFRDVVGTTPKRFRERS